MTAFACERAAREYPGWGLATLQIRFRAMVERGESLVLQATAKDAGIYEVTAKNARGEVAVSAVATFAL